MRQKETQFRSDATRVQHLFRYQPSGTYFARLKVGGKSIRKSLETTVFSVAQLRLPDAIKESRKIEEARQRFGNGRMSFGDAVQIYCGDLDFNPDLCPTSNGITRSCLIPLQTLSPTCSKRCAPD